MGVLSGVTIIEMVGVGPGPFCGMILADMGAKAIAVKRPANDERAQGLARYSAGASGQSILR